MVHCVIHARSGCNPIGCHFFDEHEPSYSLGGPFANTSIPFTAIAFQNIPDSILDSPPPELPRISKKTYRTKIMKQPPPDASTARTNESGQVGGVAVITALA